MIIPPRSMIVISDEFKRLEDISEIRSDKEVMAFL
jgi:hypothetical protein